MKKVLLSLALLALPALASAQTYCEGRPYDAHNQLSLSYVSCWFPGSTATSFATFTCTTNQQAILHFQFKVPAPITSSNACTAIIDVVQNPGNPLPNFYHYEPSGCAGSVAATKGATLNVGGPPPQACTDAGFGFFCDDGSAGNDCALSGYAYGADSPVVGIGRFAASAVRNAGTPLNPGTNYWLWAINFFSRQRLTCTGCGTPATVIWQSLGLQSDDGAADVCLTGPDSEKGPDRASQSGGNLGGPTPVQNTTWGQIKALYR